jgi:hypothetical protein
MIFDYFGVCVFSHAMFQFLELIESTTVDPVEWLLDTGKELERSCNFAMALKYYFAGRMFFARLKQSNQHPCLSEQKWIEGEYEQQFDSLYEELLPMTNAQVYL